MSEAPPNAANGEIAAPSDLAPSPSSVSSACKTPDTPSTGAADLVQLVVGFEEISLQEKVGHGSYGVVYKALWNGRTVAVKEFEPNAEQRAIETEVKQLSRVRHKNIIALYGISSDHQSTYLIMEFAEGGSLHNFLHGKAKPYYSSAHAISWARQCAEGVAYLHAMKPKPLIHRDLKPLNLLLTNKGRNLKICDFGTVADKSTKMSNNRGSAAWMAPEVFEGSKYTEKCDVFSWAIVLWEVLSRQQPFKEVDNTYSILWKIHKGQRPPLIKNCPEPIQNLMTSCWAMLSDSRPSMQYVVEVMNELAEAFPGADEPLEYEFGKHQVNTPAESESNDNYTLDFSSYTNSTHAHNTNSSQVTPTNSNVHSNSSESSTPTNPPADIDLSSSQQPQQTHPTAQITASTRWDVIPEEPEWVPDDPSMGGNVFNLTPSAASVKRMETIRNGISQAVNVIMAPLAVDVDLNAWELNCGEPAGGFAKADGKEHLTVTDAKPLLGGSGDEQLGHSSDETDEEIDGTDQSLHEMLDPELQPEPPIPDNNDSQKIYREHRRLAKEFLRIDTDLYYARDLKEKLLMKMDPAERQQKQEILKKKKERDELRELYMNLKRQMDGAGVRAGPFVQRQVSQDSVADDGWVVIAPNQNT